jgi:uncharacterized membrane protein
MKRLFRDLALILVFAALWASGGYLVGLAIEIALIPYPSLKIILAALNVIVGLLLLLGITRDPTTERLFFEGPSTPGGGDIRIGCLWAMPASLLLIGLFTWVTAILLRFISFR